MNVVYVLSKEGKPLMPCCCAIARLLLKDGKAKVVRRNPFTIKLLVQIEQNYTHPLTLGVDTGSSVIGSAVADAEGHVVNLSEVTVRNDIATTMKERASKPAIAVSAKPDIARLAGSIASTRSGQAASRRR